MAYIVGFAAALAVSGLYGWRRAQRKSAAMRVHVALESQLQRHLGDAATKVYELNHVVAQVGELFDHIGVDLERTSHLQASADLKFLGHVLRRRCTISDYDVQPDVQRQLGVIGDRYGIEPDGGSPPVFDLARIVRLAEEILETSVGAPAGVIPAAVAVSTPHRTQHCCIAESAPLLVSAACVMAR